MNLEKSIFQSIKKTRFATLLAKRVINMIKPLTGKDLVNAFIVDDSLFERTGCEKTQFGAKVFDHCDIRYKKGFRLMTLSRTDGNTMIPVNNSHISSANEKHLIETMSNMTDVFSSDSVGNLQRLSVPWLKSD